MEEFKSFGEFQKELHNSPGNESVSGVPHSGPPDEERRKLRKRRKKRTRKKIRYAAAASAAVILIFAGLCVFPVPFGDLRVFGNESVSREDVLFDGGIEAPVNVLQISTRELEERLKKDLRIDSVEVRRSFPVYIDVTITERKPLAVMQAEFGYVVLDKEGMVLQTGSTVEEVKSPIVTGVKLGNALLGDTAGGAQVQSALQFLNALSAGGLHDFSEINIGNSENIVAYTRGGIAVHLGEGDQMQERAALAENMVSDVKARGLAVEYIDASLTSPYIKLKK